MKVWAVTKRYEGIIRLFTTKRLAKQYVADWVECNPYDDDLGVHSVKLDRMFDKGVGI